MGDGYEEVTYTRHSFSEPSGHQSELRHVNSKGRRTTVWPSLESRVVVKDGIAVFAGLKAVNRPTLKKGWEPGPRLLVAKAPETPMDITPQVIGQWARASGRDIEMALGSAYLIAPKLQDNKLCSEFEFSEGNWPAAVICLTLDQVLSIMREVRAEGIERKDPTVGARYLEKTFKPEQPK